MHGIDLVDDLSSSWEEDWLTPVVAAADGKRCVYHGGLVVQRYRWVEAEGWKDWLDVIILRQYIGFFKA